MSDSPADLLFTLACLLTLGAFLLVVFGLFALIRRVWRALASWRARRRAVQRLEGEQSPWSA